MFERLRRTRRRVALDAAIARRDFAAGPVDAALEAVIPHVPVACTLREDLLVCEDCDLLHTHPTWQREPTDALAPSARHFECQRCGGALGLARHGSFDLPLALALTGLVMLVIAHANPVMQIDLQGQVRSATLWEAAMALYDDGAWFMSVLVLFTTLVSPFLEMGAVAYVLLPLRAGQLAPGAELVLRVMQAVRPWVMVEVLMLGMLVAFVKLSDLARATVETGVWAFGAVMLLSAAMASAFDHENVWAATAAARKVARAG